MPTNTNLPTVVLAGRPNVGKSTLFNRLLHKRRTITDPTPGVTRDPVEAVAVINGKPVRLIDTGGFKLDRLMGTPRVHRDKRCLSGYAAVREPKKTPMLQETREGFSLSGGRKTVSNSIDDLVVERTLAMVEKANIIVLLLEAGEITSEDEEFIKILRPYRSRLIVAVNKTEGGRLEADAWNLLSYGFEKVFMISAEHGDNIGDLTEEITGRIGFTETDAAPPSPSIRITILGKPNTGKSTLSNRLTSSNASIVSDIPGTTRDVIEGGFSWKSRDFTILDTAGIRRRTKVNENIEYYSVNRAIKTIDEADIVILLIDSEEGLSEQDKKIAALAHNKGRGIIMALNKWDTAPKIKNAFEAARDRIRFMFGKMEFAPVLPLSAKDGTGVDKLLNTAVTMYGQLNTQVETSRLNQALKRWLEETPPPSGPQTRFSVKYAVQSSTNPVRFIFFVSRPKAVSEAYVSYLRNRIRKDLGFSLIPVEVKIRGSKKEKNEK